MVEPPAIICFKPSTCFLSCCPRPNHQQVWFFISLVQTVLLRPVVKIDFLPFFCRKSIVVPHERS